jgi:AraC family transcriptional regulator
VDDDSFLVLNHGRVYSTSIRAPWPVESLAICFRQGLAEQAAAAMAMSLAQALEHDDTLAGEPPEFMESLQPHDRLVSPVLRFIRAHLMLGLDDEAWYEEQLLFLLERMLAHRIRAFALADELQMLRRARSREVFRRIGVATDFLNTNYTQTLVLADVARVACLSKHHFLRLFTRLHGITPLTYCSASAPSWHCDFCRSARWPLAKSLPASASRIAARSCDRSGAGRGSAHRRYASPSP